MHALLPKKTDQCVGNLVRPARLRHHFPQHGPQANHHRDMAQRAPHPRFEGVHDGLHGHTRHHRQRNGDGHQRDKWVCFVAGDQDDQHNDGTKRSKQKEGSVAGDQRSLHNGLLVSEFLAV